MSTLISSKDIRTFWSDMRHQVSNQPLFRQMLNQEALRVGLFCDTDSRVGLVVYSKSPISSKLAYNNIKIFHNKKGVFWEIVLKLLNSDLEFPFAVLCAQIINGLNETQIIDGGKYLSQHLERWNNLLSRRHDLTDEKERGLWCELHILELATKRYGLLNTIKAWTGPHGTPQDFCYEDGYVEVKTLYDKAGEIKISSLDQLDPIGDLYLSLVGITTSDAGLTLKEKVDKLRVIFSEPQYEILLNDNLLMSGYSEETERVGSNKKYSALEVSWYRASAPDFPSLRRTAVNPAIIKAKYSLAVSAIESFRTEGLF